MAERHRSNDGKSETQEILGGQPDAAPDHQGRGGGQLNRKIGTRDEEKRLDETSSSATRPLGGDKNDSGDKEKV